MTSIFLKYAILACLALGASDWRAIARRLTGYSETDRKEAIAKLRATPHLSEVLQGSLQGADKALALDVIAALDLQSFLPDLLKISRDDADGTTYLAIDALLNDGNGRLIAETYAKRLREMPAHPVALTAQIIMLDTLARLGMRLPEMEILSLLKSPVYAVRSSALYYAGEWMRKQHRADFESVLHVALFSEPYQLRVQAIYSIWDLRDLLGARVRQWLRECAADDSEEVRNLCKSLQNGTLPS